MKKNKKEMDRTWDNFLPFYSQWYWQRAKIYPYKKTKAYYHGPREEWMYLMEDEDEQSSTQKKET